MAMPSRRSEPLVGESVEKVQVTLLDLAHRFERARLAYRTLETREAKHDLDPTSRMELQAAILTDVRIVQQQCTGFANNRGVLMEFTAEVAEVMRRVRLLEKRHTWASRRKAFEMRTIGMLALCEAWLE